MFTALLLYAGLLPLVASAAIAFVMQRARAPSQIIWAVAPTGGFLAGQFTLRNGFSDSFHSFLQPHEAVDWLPHVVLLALGVSVLMNSAPSQRRLVIVLGVALCVAAPVRFLSGNVAHHWTIVEKFAHLSLLATTLGALWLLLASKGDEQPSVLRVPLLILVAVGAAIVVTLSGVLVYGLSAGAVGAAITGTALASLAATGWTNVQQRFSFSGIQGTAGLIAFSLGSLIILGHFYSELSTLNAALLILSLAATAAPLPKFITSGPAWQSLVARTMLCVLLLAIAVVGVIA